MSGQGPVLIVEGDGDQKAVPELLRKLMYDLNIYHMQPAPRPIKAGDIKKLQRPGVLEKFIEYAWKRDDGDSVLLILDCDDACAYEVATEFEKRILGMYFSPAKKIGICFMVKEFEALFFASMDSIVSICSEYNWNIEHFEKFKSSENIRGAKEQLSTCMRGTSYKETRDQVKLIAGLDLACLRARSRSFRHLEKTIKWLADDDSDCHVYPIRTVRDK